MYNALRSEDAAGSQGTTRLHMDMADALNIMVHAEPMPDGSPGYAAWDLFHSDDSDKIRQFLKNKYLIKAASATAGAASSSNGNGNGNASTAKPLLHDPIHSQQFYLDSTMRLELFVTMGVMSHRVYQKPGEAVFIPAGCAHQVSVSLRFFVCLLGLTDTIREKRYATSRTASR
jgi:lysine-specific demethylase 3